MMEAIIVCEDADRVVDTRALVVELSIDHEHAERCVGARLAWMARWGFVRREKPGIWSITRKGRDLIAVNPKARTGVVGALSDADYCAEVAALALRKRVGPEARRLAVREWNHYTRRP
jgi:hypothetical protein